MVKQRFVLYCLGLICLGIYLFATAPPPLPETRNQQADIPVERLFEIVKWENDVVRALWTGEIVAKGKAAGLKFDEHWREPTIEAGPLPALFLRETAKSLEKNPNPLSLFLGSDFPINAANRFEGLQLEKFKALKETQKPQLFYLADIQMQVAMFADVAVNEACIQCHNAHEQSPKKDWKLKEVMGATTWMYPKATVCTEEVMQTIAALHQGFREAYQTYLDKAKTFANPPMIGEHWPADGYYLPAPEVFMQEIVKRTAHRTLTLLIDMPTHPNHTSATDLREFPHVATR